MLHPGHGDLNGAASKRLRGDEHDSMAMEDEGDKGSAGSATNGLLGGGAEGRYSNRSKYKCGLCGQVCTCFAVSLF